MGIKIFLNILLYLLCTSYSFGQSIYSHSLQDIDGQPIVLNHFKGKMLLFVILPKNCDSLKTEICAFKNKYQDVVQVIGVLDTSIDYGNPVVLRESFDDGAVTKIILTEKMHLNGASHPIFQWLSDPANHHSMLREVYRPGFTFLINGQGTCITVNPPSVSLSSSFISLYLRDKFSD